MIDSRVFDDFSSSQHLFMPGLLALNDYEIRPAPLYRWIFHPWMKLVI